MQSLAFLKRVVWHLCPAGAQHGQEALTAPTHSRQPLSTRKSQEGLELHARIGAEEFEAPRLRSRQLVLGVLLGAQQLQREVVHVGEGLVRV